ncbi:Radical SAM superfamily protein [uncultured archaeon]|nr:Radical SAM superfamily protein [uncultured archaeon]
MVKKILLVEPKFPTKTKSKNHKNFLPIGLLKLAAYYGNKNYDVELVRGKAKPRKLEVPSTVEITSLFTYWSEQVWDCVEFYRALFPDSKRTEIRIGGIYASLRFDDPDFKAKCQKYEVASFRGVEKEAEKFPPDYKLVMNGENNIDYQIVHSSRGCFRNCAFCGTWIIEPEFEPKRSIKNIIEPGLELGLRNLVFYDNNLLYNPYIEELLEELIELKRQKKIGWCESQSGFDGKLLLKNPELATMLKKAGFREPRIAWDWGYEKHDEVEKQIQILQDAGFNRKDIYIFMIYNWDLDFEEMEKKRMECYKWKVQISDCRNRPLTQLHDHYKPLKDQNDGLDYHINPNWTDAEVKQFRKNVRRQNIIVRQGLKYHSKLLENKKNFSRERFRELKAMSIEDARKYLPDLWEPSEITPPKNRDKWIVEKAKHVDYIQLPLFAELVA